MANSFYFFFYFTDLIPIIFLVALNRRLRRNNIQFWILFLFYFIYSLLNNIVLILLPRPPLLEEAFYYRIFTIIEFSVISYFFYGISHIRILKRFILFLSLAGLIFFLVRFTLFKSNDALGSLEITIVSIQIIIYSLFYLFEQIQEPRNFLIYNTTEFWFVTGVLIYFSGTFFIFIYTKDYLANNDDFAQLYNIINSSLYLVKNLLVTIGLLVSNKSIGINNKDNDLFA